MFLFEFKFKNDTIKSHLVSWMRETETDYFYDGQRLFADIYGCGEYYLVAAENVGGDVFEVYANKDTVKHISGLKRLFPMKPKAVSVTEPIRKVRVTFPDGEKIVTNIRLCSKKAKDFYLGNMFKVKSGTEYAKEVEILG